MTSDEKQNALRVLEQLEKQLEDLYSIMPVVASKMLSKVRIVRGYLQ